MAGTLSGCMVGPHYHQPNPAAPASYKGAGQPNTPAPLSEVVEQPFDDAWWNSFRDPELTKLERDLSTQNLDLQQATANLGSSRAEMMIAGAERFPMMGIQGQYRLTQPSSRQLQEILHRIGKSSPGPFGSMVGQSSKDAEIPLLNAWNYGVDANYEVDLWGRVARQYEAAKAIADASAWHRRTVLIASQADLARDYLHLRGDQKRAAILAATHGTVEGLVNLTTNRYRTGLVSEVDVEAMQARLHEVEVAQHGLTQAISQEQNAIAMLLGKEPHALDMELGISPIPAVPPQVPIGLPSELAHRRPDIREAEAILRQTVAETGQATADFYPKFTIDANFGMSTLSFKDLAMWSARTWNVGPAITIPIFQGGRLWGQLRLKKEQQKEAAVTYRKTVLKAWHEVDNALVAYREGQFRKIGLEGTARDNKRRLTLATSQYRSGLATYLDVLSAQTDLQNAQMATAQSDADLADGMAKLYNALGGGWKDVLPDKGKDVKLANAVEEEAVNQTANGVENSYKTRPAAQQGGGGDSLHFPGVVSPPIAPAAAVDALVPTPAPH
ncbi:efflux transporter outer membrane subunit [Formicincola oecophyllae]|uniref:Efflux transporter outer membrane subunit n=1 Tax=Formicincola oecophyllae TaxID=2558361 RepID=A0A4Y6UCL4_9PROT|nr:efflux transporter outer membrane subunit [Formicincola oecophyllae]QDH14298.1 efflux transporter outer membrane subunit [Formicincola oecophyllae]